MDDHTNIVLIGMPGVGKSTIGVLLAKQLGKAFIDTDILIQTAEGRYLWQIIAEKGVEEFCRIEAHHILNQWFDNQVIATGGSVIYSPKAMAHLHSNGVVVYLQIDMDPLTKRIANLDRRGVIRAPGQSIAMLYTERCPIYTRHADMTINTNGLLPDEVVGCIAQAISGFNVHS